jgi:hypothetical protein
MNVHFTNRLNEPWTALKNQTGRKPVLYDFKYHLLTRIHFINHDLKICTVMTSLPLVDKCNTHFPYIFASSYERRSKHSLSRTTLSLHHCCSKSTLSPFVRQLYTSAAIST